MPAGALPTSPQARSAAGATAPPSRAAALAARMAAEAAAAAQPQLTIKVQAARHATRRPDVAALLAASLPQSPMSLAPLSPPPAGGSSRSSRPGSAVKLEPAALQTPPPLPPLPAFSSFVAFEAPTASGASGADGGQWVESEPVVGPNPEYNLEATFPLRVNSALLARLSARPIVVQVREAFASTEQALAFHSTLQAQQQALHVPLSSPASSPRGEAAAAAAAAARPPTPGAALNNGVSPAIQGVISDDSAGTSRSPMDPQQRGRAGIPMGEVHVSLSSLLHAQLRAPTSPESLELEGWFPLVTPATAGLAPSKDFFAPDPDLATPETLVPFGWHQSQSPQSATTEGAAGSSAAANAANAAAAAAANANKSARPSAPSTPERTAVRRVPPTGAKGGKDDVDMLAPLSALSAVPVAQVPPMEVFVSIRLSRSLLSDAGGDATAAQAMFLDLSLARASALPARWLQDFSMLDGEKDRARLEADAAIQAWRKKGAKRATMMPPPGSKGAAAKEENKKRATAGNALGAGAAGAAGTGAGGKKQDKERLRELEVRAQAERLNSFYRFGLEVRLPLGGGADAGRGDQSVFVHRESCATLELPTEAEMEALGPVDTGAAADSAHNIAPTGASPRPRSGSNSAPNSARKTGTANAAAAGADAGSSKRSAKKLEEERVAREQAEAAELAAARLAARMNARFIPFNTQLRVLLSPPAAAHFRSAIEASASSGSGGSPSPIAVYLWRELVSLDPSSSGSVIARDVLSAEAQFDLRSLLRPAATNLPPGGGALEARLVLDGRVRAQMEAERAAAIQAAQAQLALAQGGGGGEAASLPTSPLPAHSDEADHSAGGDKVTQRATTGVLPLGSAATAAAVAVAGGGGKKSARKTARGSMGDEAGQGLALTTASAALDSASTPVSDPFLSARTSLSLSLRCSRPLVALVVKPRLLLAEVIAPRSRPPPLEAPTASTQVSEELLAFVRQLAVEYRAIVAQALAAQQAAAQVQAQQDGEEDASAREPLDPVALAESVASALLYRLNSSGMYHAFRERLKPLLSLLHSEARMVEAAPTARSQGPNLARRTERLYADVLDRVHLTLNELFHPLAHATPSTLTSRAALPPPVVLAPLLEGPGGATGAGAAANGGYYALVHPEGVATELHSAARMQVAAEMALEDLAQASTRLAVLALEAELQGDFARAAHMHQRRCHLEYLSQTGSGATATTVAVAVAPEDTAKAWFDAACFHLRLGAPHAARLALRTGISICPRGNVASLLALASLALNRALELQSQGQGKGKSVEAEEELDLVEVLLRTLEEQEGVAARGNKEHAQRFFVLRAVEALLHEEPERAEQYFARAAEGEPEVQTRSVRPASGASISSSSVAPTATAVIPGLPAVAPLSLPKDLKLAPITTASPGPASTSTSTFTAPPSSEGGGGDESTSVSTKVASYALGLGLANLAQTLLEREEANLGQGVAHSTLVARVAAARLGVGPLLRTGARNSAQQRAWLMQAEEALKRAQSHALDAGQALDSYALQGHLAYQLGDVARARQAYEVVQSWEPARVDPLLLYRLAVMYAQEGLWEQAREVYLQLCAVASCCAGWLGVGQACLALGDAEGAEAALIQANLLDKSNPAVWARLALVSLRAAERGGGANGVGGDVPGPNHLALAHRALHYALSLGCTEVDVLARVAASYSAKGYTSLASATLEHCLTLRDSPRTRCQLARLHMRAEEPEQAELHLAQAARLLATGGDEDDADEVRELWEQVQRKLGRVLPPPPMGNEENEQEDQQQQQQQQYHSHAEAEAEQQQHAEFDEAELHQPVEIEAQ